MNKRKLLYYDILRFHPSVLSYMEEKFEIISLPNPDDDKEGILKEVDVLMAPLGYPVDSYKIDQCPNLKVIASSTLSIPHIDAQYAESKGIEVCYLSNEHQEFLNSITPTAELCWGLIIAITRRIPWAHKAVCSGRWNGREFGKQTPRMLSNMTLGIMGFGRLGSIVASYGKAFGMKVYYYSPNSKTSEYNQCESLRELARVSDIISIHSHLTAETEKIIDREFFQAMKPGSFFINTARGAIVDEGALLESLQSNHLAGATLDVLADEYERDFRDKLKDNPLVEYAKENTNLIITPHYAGATVDAWVKTQCKTIELVIATLE